MGNHGLLELHGRRIGRCRSFGLDAHMDQQLVPHVLNRKDLVYSKGYSRNDLRYSLFNASLRLGYCFCHKALDLLANRFVDRPLKNIGGWGVHDLPFVVMQENVEMNNSTKIHYCCKEAI